MGTVITEGVGGGKLGTETVRRPNDFQVQTQKKKLIGSWCIYANCMHTGGQGKMPFLQPVCPKPHFVHLVVYQEKDRRFHRKQHFRLINGISHLSESCKQTCYMFVLFWFSKLFCCLPILLGEQWLVSFLHGRAVCSMHRLCCQRQRQALTGLRNKKGGQTEGPGCFLFLHSPYFISLLVVQGRKVRIRKQLCTGVLNSIGETSQTHRLSSHLAPRWWADYPKCWTSLQ